MTFKIKGQGHSANEHKSRYCISQDIIRWGSGHIISTPMFFNHEEQNMTMTFKVKGQCHTAKSLPNIGRRVRIMICSPT